MIFLYFASEAYKSRAKVLTESITKFHPEAKIVHIDPGSGTTDQYLKGLAKVRLEKALDLLCTTDDDVTLIGADCELFAPLHFNEFLAESDVAIVPHVKSPLKDREYMAQIYRTGHANGDFMVFRNCYNSKRILKWLISVTEDGDKPGAFYEQTWLSSLPFLFEGIYIIRHPGYNVAYWDVNHVKFSENLVLFHYSGYEKGKPEQMSKHSGEKAGSEEVLEFYKRYDERI